jgi:hypothetical protein
LAGPEISKVPNELTDEVLADVPVKHFVVLLEECDLEVLRELRASERTTVRQAAREIAALTTNTRH